MDQADEIVQEFLVECYDALDKLDADFLALEQNPHDRDRLANIFRTVHTVKGTSGFLEFHKLEKVAHVGENLLVPLRDGEIELDHQIVDSLLGMVDAIREILGRVEADGTEGEQDYGDLIARLEQVKQDAVAGGRGEPAMSPTDEGAGEPDSPESTAGHVDSTEAPTSTRLAEENGESESRTKTQAPHAARDPDVEQRTAASPREPASSSPAASQPQPRLLSDATVRINVDLLDQLMNLVGELVLTRNQILQHNQESTDSALTAATQRLNLITSELQEGVMKTRMQPIRSAWNKLPRVVRDLSASCGKQVRVEMQGADTELDKTILEAIKDPLTHIVRNSVDHGIETPEEREAAGKPREGTLLLRAFHEGGQVNIEIIDDGAGINLDRVRDKAIEKGLITAERAGTMNERELMNLILLPGFSTAPKVTNVSGRGVGMDVVRTNIEKIGGSLELQSVAGQGTTLRIKIPLTLAIIPALIVQAGGGQFAIPQVSLLELVRLDGERAKREIEWIHNVPVYRLRGNLLPLLYLDQQLELGGHRSFGAADETLSESTDRCAESGGDATAEPLEDLASVNIVVLQAEDRQFGLVVHSISDTQEIVVKPLGKQLSNLSTFAGATIMGDGTVALILDVVGLAERGGILTENRDAVVADASDEATQSNTEIRSMLIVDRGDGIRTAIELASVSRLEEFPREAVERTDRGHVVQYRGGILPLVSMLPDVNLASDALPDAVEEEPIPVIVFSCQGRSVGVVVGEIIDVVEHPVSAPAGGAEDDRATELVVIQERVTQVVDLEQVFLQQLPQFDTTPCPA